MASDDVASTLHQSLARGDAHMLRVSGSDNSDCGYGSESESDSYLDDETHPHTVQAMHVAREHGCGLRVGTDGWRSPRHRMKSSNED